MNLDELLAATPAALEELIAELIRRGHECMLVDPASQLSACFLVALRATSLLSGLRLMLYPEIRDSFEVVARAHLEARDLLMSFRFDDHGARKKIGYWFAGTADSAWKAEHIKIDEFLTKRGAVDLQLAANWSRITVLSHPTKYAAEHSAAILVACATGRIQDEDFSHKIADFLLMFSRLILAVTYDLEGWVSLGLDNARIPTLDPLADEIERVALPILNAATDRPLPKQSYRS